MTISTYYLNCEYDFEKEEEKNAFKEKVEMTLNRMRFQIALKEKEQLFEKNPDDCLKVCEQLVVDYFSEKPALVAAWKNYGKNVIVTLPAVWEMSSDASKAKISFYFEPLLIYGWIKKMYDNRPAVVEAEVDDVIKSTKGEMNYVLNNIKRYVLGHEAWKAPITDRMIMNFFFVILGLVDGALKPEHKEKLPKMVFDFLTKGKGSKDKEKQPFEMGFSKFIGLFAAHHYFDISKPVELSQLFFEGSKKYNDDIGKGKSHKANELKAFHNICEMAEGYLPKI